MVMFKLQLVYPDGETIRFNGGGQFEMDLVEACTQAIVKRGVGVFRTEAHVRQAITEGIEEAVRGLKASSRQLL